MGCSWLFLTVVGLESGFPLTSAIKQIAEIKKKSREVGAVRRMWHQVCSLWVMGFRPWTEWELNKAWPCTCCWAVLQAHSGCPEGRTQRPSALLWQRWWVYRVYRPSPDPQEHKTNLSCPPVEKFPRREEIRSALSGPPGPPSWPAERANSAGVPHPQGSPLQFSCRGRGSPARIPRGLDT